MLLGLKAHLTRRIRQHGLVVVAVAACLVAAQPASARSGCTTLPGRSGLDQYCETIPGPTGDRSVGQGGGTGRHISSSTRRRLERSGAAGAAVLGLTGGSSGGGSSSGGGGAGDGGGGGKSSTGGKSSSGGSKRGSGGSASDEPSNNVLSAVRSSADSGSTIGPAFVWVLAILAVLLAGVAWVRYRVRGRST